MQLSILARTRSVSGGGFRGTYAVEYDPSIKSPLSSSNRPNGLARCKSGRVSPRVLGEQNLRTPPCGCSLRSNKQRFWTRVSGYRRTLDSTRRTSRAPPHPPGATAPSSPPPSPPAISRRPGVAERGLRPTGFHRVFRNLKIRLYSISRRQIIAAT